MGTRAQSFGRRPATFNLWLTTALLLAAAVGVAEDRPPVPSQAPRTILLITVDTLRADIVSFAGYAKSTTPFLDSLAETGVVLERAYAPSSWTAPSMASLFSGVHPVSHGVITGRRDRETGAVHQPALADSFVTLAESLKKAGYVTIGVPSNRHLGGRLGFAQGFDHFPEKTRFLLTAPEVHEELRRLMTAAFGANWRQEWKLRKTFLWIHYFDPHVPYRAREPWIHEYAPAYSRKPELFPVGLNPPGIAKRLATLGTSFGRRLRPLYESEVSFLDDHLRQLNAEIGFDTSDVALIFTSDHGEELLEHGDFYHGRTLYEEVVRVPLLVRWPGGLPAGQRRAAPVSLVDIFPTLLDLCGLEHPPGLQGTSLARLIRDGSWNVERGLPFELEPRVLHDPVPMIAWTDGRWKLIRERRRGTRAMLFDLVNDPGESRDVAASNRDLVRHLELALKGWLVGAPRPPEDLREMESRDEDLKRELEALGYIGR